MADLTAQRTLVKSPPELWSEVSEVESLARHLGEFGDIRITRLEPEHTVAWEGEHASGTVALEASGWGTKVTLSVAITEPDPPPAVESEAADEPASEPEPEPSTAELAAIEFTSLQPAPEAAAAPPADPAPVNEPAASPPPVRTRGGFFTRLFRRRDPAPAATASPEPAAAPPERPPAPAVSAPPPAPAPPEREPIVEKPMAAESQPKPTAIGEQRAREVLDGALDDLGAAHHRPFSRG